MNYISRLEKKKKKKVNYISRRLAIILLVLIIIASAGVVVVFQFGGIIKSSVIGSGNHTLLILGADPSEGRPGPGAVDMAFIAYVNNSAITKVTPLYPGGMAHPTASPPAEAAAQGDTKLYLHDTLWWNDTNKDAKLAQETVEYNTGIKTDGVVIVKTNALDAIIQAVGPIYVSGVQVPDNNSIDFLRQEQENGMNRGNAVLTVGNAIKNATHDKTKRQDLVNAISQQYSQGNIIVVPQSLYNQLFTEGILNTIFSNSK